MKPPFSYYGGKCGLSKRIVALMPAHQTYIEPFAGSLAVLFAKPPARNEIVNDACGRVVNFFRVLRDQPDALERACAFSPHARDEFEACRVGIDDPAVDPVERARRFFVRVTQSFAKTGNDNTGWSVTTARTQSVPDTLQSRVGRFAGIAARLLHVSVEHCDAAELVERMGKPGAVVYADPPYVGAVRVGTADDYNVEMDDAGHERLAAALHATPATVLLSGYPSPLYERLYADWDFVDFKVTAFSSNGVRGDREGRTERLWSNRPLLRHGPLFAEAAP